MKFFLDEIDKKILTILKNNSRTSFTKIAKELDLSEGAIRKRIKSLVERKIIEKFTIEANEMLYPVKAITLVKVNVKASIDKIVESIKKLEGISNVYPITGAYDILVELSVESNAELQRKITSIRNLKGVVSTLTMSVLK
jgi:Lrp/AsnC family transcriptional regulator for asnA, asnC and gidA